MSSENGYEFHTSELHTGPAGNGLSICDLGRTNGGLDSSSDALGLVAILPVCGLSKVALSKLQDSHTGSTSRDTKQDLSSQVTGLGFTHRHLYVLFGAVVCRQIQ